MSETKTGGPAFEQTSCTGGAAVVHAHGMSLRDYFAAKALMGLLSGSSHYIGPEAAADYAFKVADAMIAAREQP